MIDEELQRDENWDFDNAERRPGKKAVRVVVSVAFRGDDFDRVSQCAEQLGKRTSEFIRDAALAQVDALKETARLATFSGSIGATVFTSEPLPETCAPGTAVAEETLSPWVLVTQ
jgi:hypothetical protein